MSKIKGAIVVDTERCKGCQLCIVACPKDVIQLAQKKVNVHGYPYAEPVSPTNVLAALHAPLFARTDVLLFIRKKWRNKVWLRKK